MKSFLVIGMGRFGQRLAYRLQEQGADIMIVDWDEKIISDLAGDFADAQIGDCTNMNVLNSFGVPDFDACFVAIGENFQSSLEITSILKELGARRVISKANSDIQSKFLLRNGADEVIYPERDTADRVAVCYSFDAIFDYVELADGFSIFEISTPESWLGYSILKLNVRREYNLNILSVKNSKAKFVPDADYVFKRKDHLIVAGTKEDVLRVTGKKGLG